MSRTTIHPGQHHRASARQRGFSMMETAAAMGVFALGFVAIASIFPVAAMIQKQTTRQFLGAEAANNVLAMMEVRKFSNDILQDFNTDTTPGLPPAVPTDLDVHPILQNLSSPGILQSSPKIFEHWMLTDRSFPSAGPPTVPGLFGRDVYAVPLVRRTKLPTSASDWQVFVFVLRKDSGSYTRVPFNAFSGWANYDGYDVSISPPVWRVPGVRGVTVGMSGTNRFTFSNAWDNGFEVDRGDQVLDSNGNIHTVESVDNGGVNVIGDIPIPMEWDGTQLAANPPNQLWYGRRSGPERDSPTIQILVLNNAVE